MESDRLPALARSIIDGNSYLTLATADREGRPWASPVWYAHRDYREFLWVSKPDARHSLNIATRRRVAIVIFDSTVAVGAAKAVYVEAVAEELTGAERELGIDAFSRKSQATGANAWTLADVTAPAAHRIYGARASAHFVLDANDERVPVEP